MKDIISQNRTFLMGLSMIAIILFHCNFAVIPGITAIVNKFGLWGVDIFLFLSGFGCSYALNKNQCGEFWKRRVFRLLPTCLFVGTVVYVADFFLLREKVDTYMVVRLFSLHRWYIQAIIICYLLCPFYYKIIKRYKISGLVALFLICFVLGRKCPNMHPFYLHWTIWRTPVFLMGLYIGIYDFEPQWKGYVVTIIALVCAVIARLGGGGLFGIGWFYFLAVAMPIVCFELSRLRIIFNRMHIDKFIEIVGSYSLEIYLTHEYAIWTLSNQPIPIICKYISLIVIVALMSYITKQVSGYFTKYIKRVFHL